MDKKFFRIWLSTLDIIIAAFLGAALGASLNPSKFLISPFAIGISMILYFIISFILKSEWLEN